MTSPIPLFDWKPIIPPSRSDTPGSTRATEVKEGRGPCTVVRLDLDRSEHAGTLSQIERKPYAALTANTVFTAMCTGRPAGV